MSLADSWIWASQTPILTLSASDDVLSVFFSCWFPHIKLLLKAEEQAKLGCFLCSVGNPHSVCWAFTIFARGLNCLEMKNGAACFSPGDPKTPLKNSLAQKAREGTTKPTDGLPHTSPQLLRPDCSAVFFLPVALEGITSFWFLVLKDYQDRQEEPSGIPSARCCSLSSCLWGRSAGISSSCHGSSRRIPRTQCTTLPWILCGRGKKFKWLGPQASSTTGKSLFGYQSLTDSAIYIIRAACINHFNW